jgi:hypothetical protein
MNDRMMKKNPQSQIDRSALLLRRINELRANLRRMDPNELALLTLAEYFPHDPSRGEFRMEVWGRDVTVSFPAWIACDENGNELNPALQGLLIYYFHTTDGTPAANRYIAFSELQDGRFYAQAFQSYTGEELSRAFGNDLDRFEQAAQKAGGHLYQFGDASYAFQFLPRITLLVVFWGGDEDFPSTYQILFDGAVTHHLPTDACAVAGSMLTRRIITENE